MDLERQDCERRRPQVRHCWSLKDWDTFFLGIHFKYIRFVFQFPSQSAQEHRKKHVRSYAHQGFLIMKESLREFRIIEHGLQKVFLVAGGKNGPRGATCTKLDRIRRTKRSGCLQRTVLFCLESRSFHGRLRHSRRCCRVSGIQKRKSTLTTGLSFGS